MSCTCVNVMLSNDISIMQDNIIILAKLNVIIPKMMIQTPVVLSNEKFNVASDHRNKKCLFQSIVISYFTYQD